MDQPLDLCITLVPPPADASPGTIAAIELRCDQLGLQHKGDVLKDPLTEKDHENVRWYLEEYAEWPYEQFLERGKKIEASLAEFGKRLYHAVCGSAGAMSVVQPWRLMQGVQGRQVSIVSELPRALSLPWELLHDEQGFLALRARTPVSLIRRLPQSELAGFPTPFEPPVRILLVTARPDDAEFVDPRNIARELLDEVQQQVDAGAIELEFLRPPTLGALRARLSDSKLPPIHVLHFDGHGAFDEERDGQGKRLSSKKQGMLAFENDDGKLDLVKAEDLAGVLQDSGVRLAVLTACQSAMGAADDALRRLSEEQRALLPRLALFEGGASENVLLMITEIPEGEWAKLRPALEQAALLTGEQVHDAIPIPFLHFHPVLTPYLRNLPGADDASLRERYAQRYYGLARDLYHEDNRHPQPVRALVQRELPNLWRALELLLEAGELDMASEMAESIVKFLTFFGLGQERDELRRRVDQAVARTRTQEGGALTQAEFLREDGLGQDEYSKDNLQSAHARFTTLLARIEAQGEGTPLGRGSYEHCLTLGRLARCLRTDGQAVAAEVRLREALAVIDALIKQQPEDRDYNRLRGQLLTERGDVLRDQGQYSQSRMAYEERLEIAKRQDDLRGQAVVLERLGLLAQVRQEYVEARSRHKVVLELFHALGEPTAEANAWYDLGLVAQEQKEWAEAGRCYRECLALNEQQGNEVNAARACNQLAIVAEAIGRPAEAEGWYKRALGLDEQVHPGGPSNATHFNNLANLLVIEVQAGRAPVARLTEAKGYAQRALAIREKLDASSEIWMTLSILADIADLEGRTEAARDYRRRERETFAAFAGNRYHIDRQHRQLIAAIAAAAKGDAQARKKVEEDLPELEAKGWHITAATQRIWAGERDWHSLVEDLDAEEALLVLRVLETIAQPTREEVFASLPIVIREAWASGDAAALEQAFQALSPEEQGKVEEAMRYLQAVGEGAKEEEELG